MLCATTGQYLSKKFEKEHNDYPILFMYLSHKEKDDQILENLFASLLKQLVQAFGMAFRSQEAQTLYQGKESGMRPNWEAFYKAFCAETSFYSR